MQHGTAPRMPPRSSRCRQAHFCPGWLLCCVLERRKSIAAGTGDSHQSRRNSAVLTGQWRTHSCGTCSWWKAAFVRDTLTPLEQERWPPLHLAARFNRLEIMKMLLDNKEHRALIEEKCKIRAATPLQVAVVNGHKEMVQLLLDRGADPECVNYRGFSLLHSAAFMGHTDMVKLLLQRKAKINMRSCRLGYTPLHSSVYKQRVGTAKFLLANGAEVNTQSLQLAHSPLQTAAYFDDVELIDVLLEHGANIGAQDQRGDSPLHTAAWFQRTAAVKLLLARGANPNMRNKSGATPLLRTVSYTKVATARALLEFGVDSSVKDTSGKSYWDRVLEDAEWSPSARDFLALLDDWWSPHDPFGFGVIAERTIVTTLLCAQRRKLHLPPELWFEIFEHLQRRDFWRVSKAVRLQV
eukprot:m.157568 g.157568  ORF g.157568 m.157568 type:complete len:409 (-) comp10232_c0_seq2:127-1353(-)